VLDSDEPDTAAELQVLRVIVKDHPGQARSYRVLPPMHFWPRCRRYSDPPQQSESETQQRIRSSKL